LFTYQQELLPPPGGVVIRRACLLVGRLVRSVALSLICFESVYL